MAAATTAVSNLSLNEVPFATNYGDILLVELQSKTIVDVNEWTLVKNLDEGRVHTKRPMGNKMHFSSSENASKALFLFWKLLLKAPRNWKLLLKAPRNMYYF
jgi:hypothetical protein